MYSVYVDIEDTYNVTDIVPAEDDGQYIQPIEVGTDEMFGLIEDNMTAQQTVTMDGSNIELMPLHLQAVRTGQFVPCPEQQLMETGVVPITDNELQRIKRVNKYRNSVKLIKEKMASPGMTLEETRGTRIRIAYRLARYLANIRGDIYPGDFMFQALHMPGLNESKWNIPLKDFRGKFKLLRGADSIINVLLEATKDEDIVYTYSTGTGRVGKTQGFSYLPPPIHDNYYPDPQKPFDVANYRKTGYVPPDYDPNNDISLIRHATVYSLLAEHLGVGRSDHIEMTALGAMLNPAISRLAWPTASELEQYEESMLLPLIEEKLTTLSTIMVEKWLQDTFGLQYIEAYDLVDTAKNFATAIHIHSPEQERSVVLNRLDRLSADCAENSMVTTELNTIKAKGNFLGLTKTVAEANIEEGEALASALEESYESKKLLEGSENDL